MRLVYIVSAGVAAAIALLWWRTASATTSTGPVLSTLAGHGHAPIWWTPEDYRTLNSMGAEVGSTGPDMLLFIHSESGGYPGAKFPKIDEHGHHIAVGISQFTQPSDALTGLNEDGREALLTKTVGEQLPYMRLYFVKGQWYKLGRTYDSPGAIYAVNFLPSRAVARGVAPNTILGTEEEFPLDASLADAARNYTVNSLNAHLAKIAKTPAYLGALQAMRDAVGDQSLSPRLPA
jgi:hypothetical protein